MYKVGVESERGSVTVCDPQQRGLGFQCSDECNI